MSTPFKNMPSTELAVICDDVGISVFNSTRPSAPGWRFHCERLGASSGPYSSMRDTLVAACNAWHRSVASEAAQ